MTSHDITLCHTSSHTPTHCTHHTAILHHIMSHYITLQHESPSHCSESQPTSAPPTAAQPLHAPVQRQAWSHMSHDSPMTHTDLRPLLLECLGLGQGLLTRLLLCLQTSFLLGTALALLLLKLVRTDTPTVTHHHAPHRLRTRPPSSASPPPQSPAAPAPDAPAPCRTHPTHQTPPTHPLPTLP